MAFYGAYQPQFLGEADIWQYLEQIEQDDEGLIPIISLNDKLFTHNIMDFRLHIYLSANAYV